MRAVPVRRTQDSRGSSLLSLGPIDKGDLPVLAGRGERTSSCTSAVGACNNPYVLFDSTSGTKSGLVVAKYTQLPSGVLYYIGPELARMVVSQYSGFS